MPTKKHMPAYDAYRRSVGLDNLPISKVPGVEAPNPFKRGKLFNVTAQHEIMTRDKKTGSNLAERLRAMAFAEE